MYRIFKNTPHKIETVIMGFSGNFVSGLAASYEVRTCYDNQLVSSGTLFETSSIYSAEVILTGTGEYRVIYFAPSGYEDAFENLIVDDYEYYKADTSSLAMQSTSLAIYGDSQYISSSMVGISASNEAVYNAVMVMSSSINYMSSSVGFLSSSMIGVSASNVQVYNAVIGMSSSIAYMSGSFSFLSSSMIDLSGSNVQVYNAVINMSGSISQISGSVGKIEKIEKGKWKIDVLTNTMTFYDEDGITIVAQFNLYDENGNPASVAVFERRPI